MNPVAKCKCGGRMDVKDSRPTELGIRRRRCCNLCRRRITTFEVVGEFGALRTRRTVDSILKQARVASVGLTDLIHHLEEQKDLPE